MSIRNCLEWNKDTKTIFKSWISSKIVLCFVLFVVLFIGIRPSFYSIISDTFDSARFLKIATEGYDYDIMNIAFFPLGPFLIKILTPIGATILNILLSLVSTYLVYILAMIRKKENPVSIASMFALSPIQVYSMLPYTEMPFITLTLLAIVLYEQKKAYPLMGIFVGLAVCTRSAGVVLIFTIAILETIQFIKTKDWKEYLKNVQWVIPAFFLSIIHLVICYKTTGNFFAFVEIEYTSWHHNRTNVFKILPDAIKCVMASTLLQERNYLYLFYQLVDFSFLVFYMIIVILNIVHSIKKKNVHFGTIYSSIMLIVLTSFYRNLNLPLVSKPRYIMSDTEIYQTCFDKKYDTIKKKYCFFSLILSTIIGLFFYCDSYFF